MNVALTREQEDAANRLVAAGAFASKEEAVARSHEWLLEASEKLAVLQRDVQAGLDEADRGEFAPLDAEDIKRRGRKRLQQSLPRAESE